MSATNVSFITVYGPLTKVSMYVNHEHIGDISVKLDAPTFSEEMLTVGDKLKSYFPSLSSVELKVIADHLSSLKS